MQTYPQSDLPELIKAAAKLKGVKIPTPDELFRAAVFGRDDEVKAYHALCAEVNVELLNAGYTHFQSGEQTYPIIPPLGEPT